MKSISGMPLLSFFAAAYGVTWSGIALVVALHGWDVGAIGSLGLVAIGIAMVSGPSLGGLVLTFAFDERQGLQDLGRRWAHWRVGLQWYALALLAVPMLLVPMLFALAWFLDPVYAPRFEPVLFPAGLGIGALEETGWTGFATPRLLARHSVGLAGFGLGVVWAIWHAMADYVGNIAALGADWLIVFAVFWIAPLPAYRMLMTWVYSRTESVLVSALMHAGYTGSLLTLAPAMPVRDALIWQGLFALMLWTLVFGLWRSGALAKKPIVEGAK